MNFMKTTSTYSQMTLQRFRPNRRRGWKRKLGCWLWTFVWMLAVWALLWWSFSALSGASPTTGSFAPPRWEGRGGEGPMTDRLKPGLQTLSATPSTDSKEGATAAILAGFGASEAVAVGIVLCVIVGLLARLWWRSVAEREEASTYSDESWDPYAGDKPVPSQAASCPQCSEALIFPRGHAPYCENCGFPDENRMEADPLAGDGLKPELQTMPEGLTRVGLIRGIVCQPAPGMGIVIKAEWAVFVPTEKHYALTPAAERLLGDLRVTLFELRAKFQGKDAPPSLEGRGDEGTITDRLKPGLQTLSATPSTDSKEGAV